MEYLFAPSLKKWDKEHQLLEREKKNSVWYSMHVLIQLFEFYYPKRLLARQHDLMQNNQRYRLPIILA